MPMGICHSASALSSVRKLLSQGHEAMQKGKPHPFGFGSPRSETSNSC